MSRDEPHTLGSRAAGKTRWVALRGETVHVLELPDRHYTSTLAREMAIAAGGDSTKVVTVSGVNLMGAPK